jgi:hypothetical protein
MLCTALPSTTPFWGFAAGDPVGGPKLMWAAEPVAGRIIFGNIPAADSAPAPEPEKNTANGV